jgi:nitrous oxidase accessory protein
MTHAVVTAAAFAAALAAAAPGDTVRLAPGVYAGRFVANVPVAVLGAPGTVLDGEGRGTVLTLRGGACVVKGLELRRSGRSLLDDDAGLRLAIAPASRVERVRFAGNLHGVYLERAGGTAIVDCTFAGLGRQVSEAENGNGIHLFYSPGVTIERADVTAHRDAAYLSFCRDVAIRGSSFHDNVRYGLHYMYSDSNRIDGCRFERNVAGAAIMFSNGLQVRDNLFRDNSGARAYGLLLRDCSHGVFEHNRFEGNTIAIFLDNSLSNRIAGNRIAGNGWGISLFASSSLNEFTGNDLVANGYPLAVDLRRSNNEFRGNHWAELPSYDLDGDGTGDAAVRPVALFAFLSKRYPDLALFAGSPGVAALSAAERTLPALSPSEVVDPAPAMRPLLPAEVARAEGARRGSPGLAAVAALVAFSGGGALWRVRRS